MHFEERYPGVVYCWDVVNEPLGNNRFEYRADDSRHLCTQREGVPNCFLEHIGEDYVEWAFLQARNTVDALGANIRLFLNDFNMMRGKKPYVIALARAVNGYATDAEGRPRRLLDGIGLEGYLGGNGRQEGCLNPEHPELLRQAILDYSAEGLEVEITELTVRNFEEEMNPAHAEYCAQLFRIFAELGAGGDNPLNSVSFWGVADFSSSDESIRCSWNTHGGLLDANFAPKQVYYAILDALRQK